MYEWSNFLAVVWVLFTTVVGVRYVLPVLSARSHKAHYVHLMAWGLPFVAGQVAQNGKLGPTWVQYQLCDLGYAVWVATLGISGFVVLYRRLGREITESDIRLWSIRSFWGFAILGHLMETWDTLWAWSYDGSLRTAIDWQDYLALTAGALLALGCYKRLGCPTFAIQLRLAMSKS